MPDAADTIANAGDPFFRLTDDAEWNACVGSQGAEINYADGYLEAAIELASAILDKRLHGQRDTMVFPILYNARHGVELTLKFATRRLIAAGVLSGGRPLDHDIKADWDLLAAADLGDEALHSLIRALVPFITSLANIDDDGQELRYAQTRDGKKSLEAVALVNVEVVRDSLQALKQILDDLKYRVLDLLQERTTGSFTSHCSRRDLFAIAKMIPSRADWGKAGFDEARDAVMARFDIGRRQFSLALKVIEHHREMGVLIGLEFPLAHLSDTQTMFVIGEWTKVHPVRPPSADTDLGVDYFSKRDWAKQKARYATQAAVQKVLLDALTPDELADLEAIYYLGRGREFSESYVEMIAHAKASHPGADDRRDAVAHLMQKTNLAYCLAVGAERLGRPSLAQQIRSARPDVTT